MALPPAFLDELRARTPLAPLIGRRTRLIRAGGRNWKGCCPFHQEKTPSFYVYEDHYHCFGCGAHGDAVSFLMRADGASFPEAVERLLDNYSLEMTAKDVPQLEEAAELIPPGTKIAITFLPNEDFPGRVAAAARVRQLGFVPVPHISARRLKSQAELENFLAALQREAAIDRAFVVAGDPPRPEGPYADALAVINTGLLARYGVTRVGISGYPEGHPEIGSEKLWQAKREKLAAISDAGHDFAVVTQFGFDAGPILGWLDQLRKANVHGLVRVGVPGPARRGSSGGTSA